MADSTLNDIGLALRNIAPNIASVLGGPVLGGLAGSAVTALEDALFGSEDTKRGPDGKVNQQDLLEAVQAPTMEQLAAIRKADQDYDTRLAQIGIDRAKVVNDAAQIDANDRANARGMQISAITSGRQSWTAPTLAFLITVGFFGLLGAMMFYQVPSENKAILDIMTGSLGTAWAGVVAFYFGSSHGKEQQDAAMSQIAAQPAGLQALPKPAA